MKKINYTHELVNNQPYTLDNHIYQCFKNSYNDNKNYIEKCVNTSEVMNLKDKRQYKDITASNLYGMIDILHSSGILTYDQYLYWQRKIFNNITANNKAVYS